MSLEAIKQCEHDAKSDQFKTIWQQKYAQLSRAYRSNINLDPEAQRLVDHFTSKQEQNT